VPTGRALGQLDAAGIGIRVRETREPKLTPELVLGQLRKHDFAVLSSVSSDGQPHSAGVNYGISRPGQALAIYVLTLKHLRKSRDIAQNPNVALVVPLTRRLLWFLPPATIQLHGRAEILDWTDEQGIEVFSRSWLGRRILAANRESHRRGESRICFLKITPDPVVYTYMIGVGIWELRRRLESGAGQVFLSHELLGSTSALIR
jgi:general stress protein 26